jgi:hypothetical protein
MTASKVSSTATHTSRSARPLPRPLWFTAALLLFLITSWIAFRQEPCPYVYAHQKTNPLYTDWWLRPIEINAPLRLPEVQADFNDVFALAGTGHVWAVGSGGLILHSADGGKHWERQYLVDPNDPAADQPVTSQTPSEPQPNNKPRPATAASLRPEVVPFWRRMVPGNPLESAFLVGFLLEIKKPPVQQQPQLDPSQQPLDSAQQNTNDPKARATPPKVALPPNSGVSNYPNEPQKTQPKRPTAQQKPPRQIAKPTQKPTSTVVQQPQQAQEPQFTLRELGNSDLYGVHFLDARNGWAAGDNGALFVSRDGGKTWKFKNVPWRSDNYRAFFFFDRFKGMLAGQSGALYETSDQGVHWLVSRSFIRFPTQFSIARLDEALLIVSADNPQRSWRISGDGVQRISADPHKIVSRRVITHSGAQHRWLGERQGVLLMKSDPGKAWRFMTRILPQSSALPRAPGNHHIFPAPWYYLSLLAVGLLFVPALRLPKPEEVSESAADLLISDNPINNSSADVFDFSAVALGLSRFLRNEKTVPPLTIAVTGEWGSGKISLMNLLRADLERYGFRPVWFNAWHHQKEENLLASLLETVRARAIPSWWRPEGAFFRAKLLKIRWLRLWPLITIFLTVFAFSLGYLHAHPGQLDAAWNFVGNLPSWLTDPAQWFHEKSQTMATDKEADGHVPWIAFLLSSAGLLISLWKGLKGFGVNPASLLARDTGTAKVKDLENLTGFRYRFAAEFKDITEALNPRTLLILIDDLDRCRPEMVLEVLESVNFLVSSGDCFVVMGMARERVVRCVGLSFKDVASELLVTTPGPGDENVKPEEVARRQRIEFAQQYLEKLINIEVPVPSPTDEQSRRLMLAAGEAPEPEEPKSRRKILVREAWALTRKALPFAAVAGLLFLGYWLGAATRRDEKPAPPTVAQASSPVQGSTPPAANAQTAAPASIKPIVTAPAKVELGVDSRLPLYPAVILLILLVGLGVWRLSIPPGVVIHDSPDFEQALRTWHPLVFSYRNTPRSIKRFLNRVRYLAMLQRKQGMKPARWAAILAKLLRRPVGVPKPAEGATTAPVAIPEDVLVALAAVEHCHPEWLQQGDFFANPQSFAGSLPEEVRSALGVTPISAYREAYVRMSRGLHVS